MSFFLRLGCLVLIAWLSERSAFSLPPEELRDEVISLCDDPNIGSISSRGTREEFVKTGARELWERVVALPDGALDITMGLLRHPEAETDSRWAGGVTLATVLVTQPQGLVANRLGEMVRPIPKFWERNGQVSRHVELESLILRRMKTTTWQEGKQIIAAALFGLRWVGGPEGLKALAALSRTVDDPQMQTHIDFTMRDIAESIPNGEALRQAALAAPAEEPEKPVPPPAPDATPAPTIPAPAPLASTPAATTSTEPATPSLATLWTCAAAAIALLVSLVVFWKRHA